MLQARVKQSGAALLTALFIMTLVAIVATAMSVRIQQEIYRTRILLTQDKLYMASQAVTFWSLSLLQTKEYPFSVPLPSGMVAVYPSNLSNMVPGLQLTGGLYDLQAQYNLNNLTNPKAMLGFVNLLTQTLPAANSIDKPALAKALQLWVMPYQPGSGEAAFTSYYLAQNPAYYPAHQLMQSKSEFRLVKGVDAAIYLALAPLVTALPEAFAAININTAPKALLQTLGNGVSADQADEIIKARGDTGIQKLSDIDPLIKKLNLPQEQITLKSEYFLAVATASSPEFSLTVYTLMRRTQKADTAPIATIIRESVNTFVF